MFSNIIFQKRLLLVRTSHNLSNSGLSNLLGLKSRTSISNLERGHMLPSVPVLNNIADLFCISIDWLTGRSNTPYNNETLCLLEKQHIDRILATDLNIIPDFDLAYITNSVIYRDPMLREKHFSLPIRANIVFIFTYVNFILDNKNKKIILDKINDFLFEIFDTGKSPTPLFDINTF